MTFFTFTGTAFLASGFSDECRVPQGFVFILERSSQPFSASTLSNVIRPNDGFKYLQIFHSVTGGQDVSAQDRNNNLRFLEWQTQEIKRTLRDLKFYVPDLQSDLSRWVAVADKMLTTAIKARRLISLTSDWLKLKLVVETLDNYLDIITRAFDLLVAQLQPYKTQQNIEKAIDRLRRLQADLPKSVSLSFFKSSIQQNFVGLRFLLDSEVCHKRLCFPDVKSSIWSLHDDHCGTSATRNETGILVEGMALNFVSLGSLISFPAGGRLRMSLTRDRDVVVTTFEGFINLLGLKKGATVRMTEKELLFHVWGPMFGEFDANLNVRAEIGNVADWNSIVFTVEGSMNKSSPFYKLLEKMITNETTMIAREATRRLAKAQAVFNNTKREANMIEELFNRAESNVESLKTKKKRAEKEREEALLEYHNAIKSFNSSYHSFQNVSNLICEIQECNYTCLENGCVIPELCQDPINITYLEPLCSTSIKTIKVPDLRNETITSSYTNKANKSVYTGNCRSNPSPEEVAAAYHLGGKVAAAATRSIFGCTDTYKMVRDPENDETVEYKKVSFSVITVKEKIVEVECTDGHMEKTKSGGYGSPYQCCKQYGCKTKVIDSGCTKKNTECEYFMRDLKYTLDAENESLRSKFQSLQKALEKAKKKTFSYEKARIRYESAVARLKQVEAYLKQQLSAKEVANASLLHIKRIMKSGLKIWQAMDTSNNTKIVDVDEMQFSVSVASGDTRRITVQSNASSVSGKSVPVSFLVDFDQPKRSASSASKTIVAKLFDGNHLRRKRSAPEDSADPVYSMHSSFLDYRYACLFANRTHLYFRNIFDSLDGLIASVKGLNANLSSGFNELVRLSLKVGTSSENGTSVFSNGSFVTEYLEMLQVFEEENMRLTKAFSKSWNSTLGAWRAFLEAFTVGKGFAECAGTQDCIGYFFEGLKEFYEFENSLRAFEIKDAIPRLEQTVNLLTSEALSMNEAEKTLHHAESLLDKTRDNSVLCGGTPLITASSQGEIVLFPGDSLLLNCSAKQEEKLTYAWKKNDEIIGASTNGTFYVSYVTKDNQGAYVCVVSNNKGSTFSNVTVVKIQSKPKITQHPLPQTVVFQSQIPAIFTCNATAEPSPTFQWFFQSINSSPVRINESKPLLYVVNPRLDQEGYYYCEASNKYGLAASQRARLDVLNYTIGRPRLLVALNLMNHCSLASTSTNRSLQTPLPCHSEPINVSTSVQDSNLTNYLLRSLASSLNISLEMITDLKYSSRNTSKISVTFLLGIDNESWKGSSFTLYMEVVEAIADAEVKIIEKLKQLNSDLFNKTFLVPLNNSTLLGEPGSMLVFPVSTECPEAQSLHKNGFICGKFPFVVILALTRYIFLF